MTGRTVIQDTPGDADLLDLSQFIGDGEFSFRNTIGGSLRIENGLGGVVDIDSFFAPGPNTIQFIDLGDGPIDVSNADFASEIEALLGLVSLGVFEDPDSDGILWNADIRTNDGSLITATEAQLIRVYLGGLGRLPDTEGYQWWLAELLAGRHDLSSVAAGFVFSSEFQGAADANSNGTVNNTEFLDYMYRVVFGRDPDTEGLAFWRAELDSGSLTQGQVLCDMTQSNEFAEITINPVVDYLVG